MTVTLNQSGSVIAAEWSQVNSTTYTKTFTNNVANELVEFENAYGTTGSALVNITWIDRISPVCDISYEPGSGSLTNQDVTASLTGCSETVTVINNGGSSEYVFIGNGSFTFEFKDAYGNTGSETATVTWIDRDVPICTISYNLTSPTVNLVIATLNCNEPTIVTNNSGNMNYIFVTNGSFSFEFKDVLGNTGNETATVTRITQPSISS